MPPSTAISIMREGDDESSAEIPSTHELNPRIYDGRNIADRDYLVNQYMHRVQSIVRMVMRRLPPNISHDDLRQEASLGILKMAKEFHGTEEEFSKRIFIRVKGAMIDFLRNEDVMPRRGRATLSEYEEYMASHPLDSLEEVAAATGHKKERIAFFLGLRSLTSINEKDPRDDYWQTSIEKTPEDVLIESMEYGCNPVEYLGSHGISPESILIVLERRQIMQQAAMAVLDGHDNEAQVYALFSSGEKQQEIALTMGFSEPRASQLLESAKQRMQQWIDENIGEY